MCAIVPGQPLLLAALVADDLLVIHPASTVVWLLTDLHAQVIGAVVPADPAHVAAARQLLAHLGVTLADLQSHSGPSLPTLAEYLPQVIAAAGPGARRTYGTYWNRMAAAWGERPLDAIAASDIEAMQRQIAATARSRRNSRSGRHAGEHVIAAARAIYNRAIADGLIDAAASTAHRVVKPRRLPSTRRALTPDELEEINLSARTSGNDVLLDALLLRLHAETACRRGGALGLRLADLDTDRGLVRLTEKGATLRWQPISLDLAAHLYEHARFRGAVLPTDRLLRYRNGRVITSRRYDHLWKRIGEQLPWVAAQGISTHWLRHTTLTWVERHFGYGVARAYAGHTDSTGPATTTYIKADLQAVAAALSALTGQPHPLAAVDRASRP
ncbi:integrase [Micromonospora globispora]|nr:integrase [Micromonospora globispora]RQW98035.1 integrase [Micromonospora globispora]